ncbi:hypothetical protein GGI25_004436 [Coemansia spiralis]|uniref:Uncharacterized protein n=2 Tax=Coemansia TaxID=4863 RepID=A0A9W8G5L7_9FUNG|nr:hypothetical protein GGI26_001642 [Coemansia sp. RSA 1358]KAJ2674219.1 hypothetical protein GGI25_004436 [Coemansia spiralis]
MSTAIMGDAQHGDAVMGSAARRSKEVESLPMPSTMGDTQLQKSSWNINQKLVDFLQYLNPLFYARIAQSLISSMLQNLSSGTMANCNSRIANDSAAANADPSIPADAIAIDCSYVNVSSGKPGDHSSNMNDISSNYFITVSPEFEYLPDLDLGPSAANISNDNLTLVTAGGQNAHSNNYADEAKNLNKLATIAKQTEQGTADDGTNKPAVGAAVDADTPNARHVSTNTGADDSKSSWLNKDVEVATDPDLDESNDDEDDATKPSKKAKRKKNKKVKGRK